MVMKMSVALLLLAFGSLATAKVFFVKPSVPSTDCPSGETPCHTLQEYADQQSFITNNSKFFFLEGEHHLNTLMEVKSIYNLSMIGANSGVLIIGLSGSAHFNIESFTRLNMKDLNISNLKVYIANGSDINFKRMTISGEITFENILSTFSIGSSTFLGPDGFLDITFKSCSSATALQFGNNTLSRTRLDVKIVCSNIEIQISDSLFENGTPVGLNVNWNELADGAVSIKDTTFANVGIFVESDCKKLCASNQLNFTEIFAINSTIQFSGHPATAISIENSALSHASMPFQFMYSKADAYGQIILQSVAVVNSTVDSPIISVYNAQLQIANSSFENNFQSVLWVIDSELLFDGDNMFRNNSGLIGGAMQLLGSSYIRVTQNGFIAFEGNHAQYVGGAIFVHNAIRNSCPFRLDTTDAIKMSFVGNTAINGGSSIYGVANYSLCGSDLFKALNVSNSEMNPSAIASDPYDLCLCDEGSRLPNCDDKQYTTYAFPGEEFLIRLATVSVIEGVVPGDIRAFSIKPPNALAEAFTSQVSRKASCEDLKFAVNTTEYVASFELTTEKYLLAKMSSDAVGFTSVSVAVFLKDCPRGFFLSNTTGTCVCDPVFDGTDVQCFINNQSFLRPTGAWIRVGESFDDPGVIYHPNCPIGYCVSHDVSFISNASDNQCESHRTGLLCGQCQDGYSLTLGDGRCKKCSNTYLLLILPLAVAGLLLVAVLFALNLTVTEGTINGLIFYANVVAMTHNILFSGQASYLYTFVAWLNLDLGISTCLYNGLDAYTETWLQFVFPVYLLVIVLVVMVVFKVFPRLGQRVGSRHSWDIVETLILLSYTKLQRAVTIIFSFTSLENSHGDVRYVWLYDANLDFFKGKHLYLGIAAAFLIVIMICYTFLLVFFQQLQALSDRKVFGWVNKLKPVFGAYSGAYQDRFRFWTGMLLVIRTLLIILFTIKPTADVHLLTIMLVSLALLTGHSNTIYTNKPLNYLESFFYFQLGVFASGIVYARHNDGNITAVADTSFGLTIIAFVIVVGYHALHRVGIFKTWNFRMKEYADIDDYSIEHDRKID